MAAKVMTETSVSFQEDLRKARDEETYNAANDALLQELEIELAERVNQMRALTDRLAIRLEKKFQCEVLLKMPKDIRSMKMREFCVNYGGDVDEALKQQAKRLRVEDMPPPPPPAGLPQRPSRISRANGSEIPPQGAAFGKTAPNSAARPTRGGARMAETPTGAAGRAGRATRGGAAVQTPRVAPGRPSTAVAFTPRLHETPRIARGGETILSANGSPINILDTVRAKAGKRGRAPEVVLTLLDGREVNLAEEETTRGLDECSREAAVNQLLQLQAQVESHLAALNRGNLQEQPDE